MGTILKCRRLLLPATCLAIVFTAGTVVWPQSPTLNITLAGQSMIRADIRVNTPTAVATISPWLSCAGHPFD